MPLASWSMHSYALREQNKTVISRILAIVVRRLEEWLREQLTLTPPFDYLCRVSHAS